MWSYGFIIVSHGYLDFLRRDGLMRCCLVFSIHSNSKDIVPLPAD